MRLIALALLSVLSSTRVVGSTFITLSLLDHVCLHRQWPTFVMQLQAVTEENIVRFTYCTFHPQANLLETASIAERCTAVISTPERSRSR